ncbi:MAG: SH3 domain-containing protein [Archangium sp.]
MITSLLLTLSLAQYTPQEAQSVFIEANDAYYRGDFDAASERYQKLLEAGLGGPDVLFNLGTSELAANRLGPAMLFLERAAKLSDDDDVSVNLAVARQRQVDQVVGDEVAVPFTQRLAAAMDERLVTIAFLATWWLGFIVLWITWRRAPGSRLITGLLAAVLIIAGGLLGGALGIAANVRENVVEAIVQPTAAKVREFPGDTARVAFEVHAGLKVRIMETSGRFVRVRLPNALEGWTEKEGVVPL